MTDDFYCEQALSGKTRIVIWPRRQLMLLLTALLGCRSGAPLRTDPDPAVQFFEQYQGLPAGELSCPSGYDALRHCTERYCDEFCGQISWPAEVRHRGAARRFGLDGRLWFEGQFGRSGRVGIWTVYGPDGTISRWDFDRGPLPCPTGTRIAVGPGASHYYCFDGIARGARGPFVAFNETMRPRIIGWRGEAGREGTWITWTHDGRLVSIEQFRHDELVGKFAPP